MTLLRVLLDGLLLITCVALLLVGGGGKPKRWERRRHLLAILTISEAEWKNVGIVLRVAHNDVDVV